MKQNLTDFFVQNEIETEINCETEWVGMPEFVQEKQTPYSMITVRFDSEKDLQEFAKLIGQPLTNKTKSIWHPKLIRGKNADFRWVDEE